MTESDPDPRPQRYGSSMEGGRFLNPIPGLEAPIQLTGDTSTRHTPDVSADIEQHLNINETTSDEDDEDSLADDDSSVTEDDEVTQKLQGLEIAELPTGLCYDARMRYHAEVSATTGENVHPEDPRRIFYIYKELCEAGLVAEPPFKKTDLVVKTPLLKIDAREATKEECCLVHTNNHYEFVRHTAGMPLGHILKLNRKLADDSPTYYRSGLTDEELIDLSEDIHMDSIYFNSLSYFSAKLSAGAAIDTCRAVVSQRVKNAIAVIRPPGHHAEVQSTMGFCLFNNVCIASRVCQQDFGPKCRKILILDWDVHHGNGCQKAFYDDPNILYISIHVHMDGRFYPSGNDGAMDKVGVGAGEGKNVNIPWPTKGMGDGDYMFAFQNVVMPIAQEFNPDLVIVAAGFDAAAGDELGGCFVTPACYAHMTHMLMSLAKGKVAVCLEGGYNFIAISKSALAVTRTLMGEPPDRLEATQATDIAMTTLQQVKEIQSRYWTCMIPKAPIGNAPKGDRLHDVVRRQQATELYERFKMTQLHIMGSPMSTSFQHQVLATRNYQDQDQLLVIFHDAPEIITPGAQISTLQRPHDMLVADGTKDYIAKAVAYNFGVIDVNIPESVTLPTVVASAPDMTAEEAAKARSHVNQTGDGLEIPYAGPLDLARRASAGLARYLWENYIEPYNFPPESIILMGCGHAFHAVARLISELPGEAVYQSAMRERDNAAGNTFGGTTTGMLAGVVGFISTNPVRPVQNNGNPWVSEWYKRNSLVYVEQSHQIFKKEGKKSKKYGNLRRVEGGTLAGIMQEEEVRREAWGFILDRVGMGVGESTEEEDVREVKQERVVKMEEREEQEEARGRVDNVAEGQSMVSAGGYETEEQRMAAEDVIMSMEK